MSEDEQTKSYEDGNFGYGDEEVNIGETRNFTHYADDEPKKDRSKLLLIIPLIAIVLVVGAIGITYMDQLANDPEIDFISYPDYQDEDILALRVVNAPPYARDSTGIDNVGDKISHTLPTTQEIIRTLVWASTTDTDRLKELEMELMNAAELNDYNISLGERYFLDIITFTAYPEYCLNDPDNKQCEFFTILYNQGLYQDGIIDRDQLWLNLKQYADEETIAAVENHDTT